MFDNTVTYVGQLEIQVNTGQVISFSENMQSEWVAVDPAVQEDETKAPNVIKMKATRFYGLEKIN